MQTSRSLEEMFLSDEEVAIINDSLAKNLSLIFCIPSVRALIAAARLKRLNPADIRTFREHDTSVATNAIEHNVDGLMNGMALTRPDLLIYPLFSIDYVRLSCANMKFLSVGPRSEAELFSLVSQGVPVQNIRGLDLISYSPFVDLGDMHKMPYENASFDAIILGWVLAYSKEPAKAVKEVLRVAKPGAFIAVGCEYNPLSSQELMKAGGFLKDDYSRFYTSDDILNLFGDSVEQVYFRHDVHPSMRNRVGSLSAVFRIKGTSGAN